MAKFEVGDRITVGGGYEEPAVWLSGREQVDGVVLKWIRGQGSGPACVVQLDEPITAESNVRGQQTTVTGMFLVLERRYAGQQWDRDGIVHVELCASEPADRAWSDREAGAWVESHAGYVIAH